jgi:hypothetical protein
VCVRGHRCTTSKQSGAASEYGVHRNSKHHGQTVSEGERASVYGTMCTGIPVHHEQTLRGVPALAAGPRQAAERRRVDPHGRAFT